MAKLPILAKKYSPLYRVYTSATFCAHQVARNKLLVTRNKLRVTRNKLRVARNNLLQATCCAQQATCCAGVNAA